MAEVHIFSGLASSIWRPFQKGTRKLERLIDALPSDADAKHHIWSSWPGVTRGIIARHKAGKLVGPVILIGHSNGVLACCNAAYELSRHGIKVAYIGAIDPTAARFKPITGNVNHVDEFWASSGYPAIKRWMTGNKRGACQFMDGWSGKKRRKKFKSSHVGLAEHSEVSARIVNQVSVLLS